MQEGDLICIKKKIFPDHRSVLFLLCLIFLFSFVSNASADDTGWISPTGYADGNNVTNPEGVYDSDPSEFATFDSTDDIISYTSFDGLSIPPGAFVTGIEVRLNGYRSNNRRLVVDLGKSATGPFTSELTATFPRNTRDDVILGSPTDLWGTSWSAADFGSGFRVRLDPNLAFGNLYLYELQVKVTYMPQSYINKTATKDWQDAGHEDSRPASVQVQLYEDGVANKPVETLNAANSWKATWNNLPQYKMVDGVLTPIDYTVKELDDLTANYITSQTTDADGNFIITNIWTDLAAGGVQTSKTVKPVEGMVNTWDITLRIETRDSYRSSDIVIVMDRSGSMGWAGGTPGNTKLQDAKIAANNFIDTMLQSATTRLAVVSFGSNVTTNQEFTNDPDALHAAINGLTAYGGTLTQGGLHVAKHLLANSTADFKTIVLLSDGQPTYSYEITAEGITDPPQESNFDYTQIDGDGSSIGNNGIAAEAESTMAKNLGQTVYTIALEAGPQGTAILRDIASPGCDYATLDSATLNTIFQNIAGRINSAATNAAVTDPMGLGFQTIGPASLIYQSPNSGTVTIDPPYTTIDWDIGTVSEPTYPGSPIKYAEIVYRIEINDSILDATGTEGMYSTNEDATLTYTDQNGDTQTVSFEDPSVDPVLLIVNKVLLDHWGNPIDDDREFNVNVQLTDESDPNPYNQDYVVQGGQRKVMTNLRMDTEYTVKENGISGSPDSTETDYETTVQVYSQTVSGFDTGLNFVIQRDGEGKPIDSDVTVTNQELPLGEITVTKILHNMAGEAIPLDGTKTFNFTITCNDFPDNPPEGVTCGSLFGLSDPPTFTLPIQTQPGVFTDSIHFTGLPYGHYTVTETPDANYSTYAEPATGNVFLTVDHKTETVTYHNNMNTSIGAGLFHKYWIGGPTSIREDVCFQALRRDYTGDDNTNPFLPTTPPYIFKIDYENQTPYTTDGGIPHYHFSWPQVVLSHLDEDENEVFYEYHVQEGTCTGSGTTGDPYVFTPYTNSSPQEDAPPNFTMTQVNEQKFKDEWGNDNKWHTPSVYDVTITNTYVIPTNGEYNATKSWVNGPTPKPTIYFQLYRKTADMAEPEPYENIAPVPLDGTEPFDTTCTPAENETGCGFEDSAWHVTWTNLKTTDIDGNPYTYSFKEGMMNEATPPAFVAGPIPGYTPTYTSTDDQNGAVENVYTPELWDKIQANKIWLNDPSETGLAYKLTRSIENGTPEIVRIEYLPADSTTWTFEWPNMPKTDLQGNVYTYNVEEGHLDPIPPSPVPEPIDPNIYTFVPGLPNYQSSGGCETHLKSDGFPEDSIVCGFINRKLVRISETKNWFDGLSATDPRPTVYFQIYVRRPAIVNDPFVPFAVTSGGYKPMDGIVDTDESCTQPSVLCEREPWVISGDVPVADMDGYLYEFAVKEGTWNSTYTVFTEAAPTGYIESGNACEINAETGNVSCYINNIALVKVVATKNWEGASKPLHMQLYRKEGASGTFTEILDPVYLDGTPDETCPEDPEGCETQAWVATWDQVCYADAITGIKYDYAFKEGTLDEDENFVPGPPEGYTATEPTCNEDPMYNWACEITNTELGSITIVKDSIPNDVQVFTFTETISDTVLTEFTLIDDSDTSTTNRKSFEDLSPGSYTVTEKDQPGWDLTNLVCTGGASIVTDLPNKKATISLSAGENITCTFTNTAIEPKLKLVKAFDPVDSGTLGNWKLKATGTGESPIILEGVAGSNNVDSSLSPAFPGTHDFKPDTYTLSEEGVSGTDADNFTPGTVWNCGSANMDGDNKITLHYGDNVTCTITNTRKSANLTLEKAWVNAKVGDKVTIPATTGLMNNTTAFDSTSTGNNTTPGTAVTVYAGETAVLGNESWKTGSATDYNSTLSCSGAVDTNLADGLTINAADTAIKCTYSNAKRPILTLAKILNPADSGDLSKWTLTATDAADATNYFSGLASTPVSGTVDPGDYVLSESGTESNFTASEWVCSGGTYNPVTDTVSLVFGDDVTCTVTNTYNSPTNGTADAQKLWNPTDVATKPAVWFQLNQNIAGGTPSPVPVLVPV
ncbi:MAG: Cna B-type domain-containing protein, partial [Chloroflexi bacterium]|nr:Cna B-type domain-containing protein [Chloroflexota bacterium]